jgi:hypothetical protein
MRIKSKISFLKNKLTYIQLLSRFPELKEIKEVVLSDDEAISKATQWIRHAHNNSLDKGVPAAYNLKDAKYLQSYRETTGYIICSLVDLYRLGGDKDLLAHAQSMAEWEVSVQHTSGGFGEIHPNGEEVLKVFNSGQIIFGLCDMYKETQNEKYCTSAKRAGDWLISILESNGSWNKHTTAGPKSYHARVAWSLLKLYQITEDDKYKIAAKANLDWVLTCFDKDNFYIHNTSLTYKSPWTHLIAYAIRGTYESALILEDINMQNKALGALDAIINSTNGNNGLLSGTFNSNWKADANYSCLTGNAQLAIVAYKVYQQSKISEYKIFADSQMKELKKLQIQSVKQEINGAITGSFPVYGDYCTNQIPNWAVKFFIDAMVLKRKCDSI